MSEEPRPRRRLVVATLVVVNVLVGLSVLAAGLFAPWGWQGRLCVALVGVGLLGNVPFGVREWSSAVRRGDRVSTREDTTVIAYDRVPAYAAAWSTGWLTVVTVLATVLGLAAGNPDGLVLGVPLGLLFGLPFLDALLALARGAEVVADPDRLTVRSWRTESSIAWDDVEQVDLARGARGIDVVVRGYGAATSWQGRRLPHAWPQRAPLTPGEVRIDARAVEPHTPWVYSVFSDWAADAASRMQVGTPAAERRLRPPLPGAVSGPTQD